jgi:hypothetical protein
MLTDIQTAVFVILAIAGALFSAALGWLDSGEVFNARKFTSSMLRAVLAGAVFSSTALVNVDLGTASFVLFAVAAFLGGAGIDVLGNRIAGAASPKTTPTPAATPHPT